MMRKTRSLPKKGVKRPLKKEKRTTMMRRMMLKKQTIGINPKKRRKNGILISTNSIFPNPKERKRLLLPPVRKQRRMISNLKMTNSKTFLTTRITMTTMTMITNQLNYASLH
jgi:hypothetical protein